MDSNHLNFEERHIAALFDEMAEEYDQLEDEWYPHLFRQIEKVSLLGIEFYGTGSV